MKLNARNIAFALVAAWCVFWVIAEVTVKRNAPVANTTELQITDVKAGTGPEAKTGDTLVVHYTVYKANGDKFESSRDKGEPHEFVLGRGEAIKGWDQGLVGMRVGGQRKLVVPPALAYPEGTPDGTLGPGETIQFDVELVKIK